MQIPALACDRSALAVGRVGVAIRLPGRRLGLTDLANEMLQLAQGADAAGGTEGEELRAGREDESQVASEYESRERGDDTEADAMRFVGIDDAGEECDGEVSDVVPADAGESIDGGRREAEREVRIVGAIFEEVRLAASSG